ncbi:polysaccharide deacetylase family protein [Micromonospora sp. WMMD956]|uniref:polysaccharide deacetylase family protein n=1 Tax=Micromonospora TaxID=1873 RepID=UPI002416D266|nr:polysaccharide deacetylase family protein [Micromonospora sp. WMMD956]MDG4815123.1 polysaccharide deacetylase family protein [Micromonospora sp. WMMD956]
MPAQTSRVPLIATLAALAGVAVLLVAPAPSDAPGRAAIGRVPTAATPPAADGEDRPGQGTNRPTPPVSASGRPGGPSRPERDGRADEPGAEPSATARPGASRTDRRPPVVDHGPRVGNLVALTFDADMTDAMRYQLRSGAVRSYANLAIIDLLERERVPATFFLTGKWVEEYPGVTRRLAANPRFELANHTYGHLAFTADCYQLPTIPRQRMAADVARTFDVIAPYGGRQTRYFRFPGLCHDRTALAELAPLGVTVVDGDVVSGDPFAKSWRPVVDAVLSRVRPGSVVVLHVTEANAPMTDEALPRILAGLAELGLRPAPLSEVLGATPAG